MSSSTGCLYIVATPIGNLGDITLRALEVLKSVDLIVAEDTRHSKRLLNHYAIQTPMLSLHQHNEQQRIATLIPRLQKGEQLALISDAGTPLISDPGFRLVSALHEQALKVVPIPGACAAIAALAVSGLNTDHFVFEGFLPTKTALREQRLRVLAQETRTIVLYESTHRIVKLLDLMQTIFEPTRMMSIARELTKTFETIHRTNIKEMQNWLIKDKNQQKGEFVVLIEGADFCEDDDILANRHLLTVLLAELPLKQAVALSAKITGGHRKQLYALALSLKEGIQGENEHEVS